MIKIDFENTYEIITLSKDFSTTTFYSPLKNGQLLILCAKITTLGNIQLPNVYNLGFGPVNPNGEIDDRIKLNHLNIDKVFSTILLFAFSFLEENPSYQIGIDGSDDTRAYLYHRMFITNRNYFKQFFLSLGVDWYVRLLRNGKVESDKNGYPLFMPKPEPFNYNRATNDLYRYYVFHLKNDFFKSPTFDL